MNIFYIIGVVVVVIFVAGYLGVHISNDIKWAGHLVPEPHGGDRKALFLGRRLDA
jgi:hypothetical protein